MQQAMIKSNNYCCQLATNFRRIELSVYPQKLSQVVGEAYSKINRNTLLSRNLIKHCIHFCKIEDSICLNTRALVIVSKTNLFHVMKMYTCTKFSLKNYNVCTWSIQLKTIKPKEKMQMLILNNMFDQPCIIL